MAKSKVEYRIRYAQNYKGLEECYLFESKSSNSDNWTLDTAYGLQKDANGENTLISYEALTKIRELQQMGISFYFA